jgi:hypothetical protein
MKILITEEQYKLIKEDTLKQSLIGNIKEFGVKDTVNMVGDFNNLCQLLNINSPMDFLHLFDDLEQVQSEQRKDLILIRYKPNYNLMIYVTKNETVYIDYDEIWSFLEDKFGLSYEETRAFTKKWLDNVYNFRGITTNQFQDAYHSRIG